MAKIISIKLASSIACICLISSLSGCDAESAKPVAKVKIANVVPAPQKMPDAATDINSTPDKFQQNVDPAPIAAEKAVIVSKEDVKIGNDPTCIFTIRYPDSIDHEVTSPKETCSAVTARFIPVAELEKAGQLEDLSAEDLEDVMRMKASGIFYVESSFTASAFPLNVAGVPVEVSLAD
jgi:hypothetical protein